jgi:hypothetical protein
MHIQCLVWMANLCNNKWLGLLERILVSCDGICAVLACTDTGYI